ncbi:MAG TPA: hypothetical protein VIG25_17325 [Pyrinomonadaceae bacterium]
MADQTFKAARLSALGPAFNRIALRPDVLRVRPEVIPHPGSPQPLPPPVPAPAPPVVPQPLPPPEVPPAPTDNPFSTLPFPSPGDRIKAEDFKRLSQSLMVIHDSLLLSASLLGRTFGEAKQALTSQQYQIQRVMSVFGNELAELGDPSLDSRKVIQVVPLELGTKGVAVVLTEAVETRRSVPNLLNLNYQEASERLHGVLGDVSVPSNPMTASQLVGLSLEQAKSITGR